MSTTKGSTPGVASSGVAVVTTRRVDHDRVADYLGWSQKVQSCLKTMPGFISAEQLPAIPGQQDFWTQIVRFSNKDDSLRWIRSPELAALLKEIESYTRNAEVSAVRIGDNDWLNFGLSTHAGPGAPAKWKQLIAGVMALYPTVIVVQYLIDRFLTWPFALSVLMTNAIAMALVMMVFLPQLSRVLHGWLLPAAPLPAWRNIGVAVLLISVVVGLFIVFSAVFPGSS